MLARGTVESTPVGTSSQSNESGGLTGAQRRDVALLAVFRGISFVGDGLAMVALYLRVAPLGHAWAVAALGIAAMAPVALLAPVAGHVVDRIRAKPLLIALGCAEAVVSVGLGYWHAIPTTIALVVVLNVSVSFSMPGYSALLPAIVGDEHVNRATGTLQATQGVAFILGPVLGGLLVGWTGQSVPLYLDAVSFALGTIGTALLHADRRPVTHEGEEDRRMTAGLRHVARDRVLAPVVLDFFVFLLALGMVNVAEVFFVIRTLHGTPLDYGALGAAFGAGTIVGSVLAGRQSHEIYPLVRRLMLMVVLAGLSVSGVSFVTDVGEIYPFMAIAGLAVGIVNVAAMTLFTLRTPEALRGRAFAAVNALTQSAQVGAFLLGGAALGLLAPRSVYRMGGLASLAAALIFGALALRAVSDHRVTSDVLE